MYMYSFSLCVLLLGTSESSKIYVTVSKALEECCYCANNIFLEISDEPKSNTHDKKLHVYLYNQQQFTWKVMD